MTMFKQFKQAVYEGKSGGNIGLPLGLTRLEKYTYGIQKKRYDLIFAAEGVGKSAFVTSTYIMTPYQHVINHAPSIDLKIRLYSLEIDAVSVIAKMVSWKLYEDKRILIAPSVILSKDRFNKIPKEIEDYIDELEPFFEEMFNHITIIDKAMTPDMIKEDVMAFAKDRGDFYTDDDGIVRYKPHNPNEHVIIITDTLGNLKLQQHGNRLDKKGTIDTHSSYCRDIYRNRLGYTVVNVAHSNRGISGMDRARYGEIFPQKDDVKDSSQPANDANLVIAIFNPTDYMNPNNNLSNFMGYKVPKFNDRFRAVGILKNRNGPNNKRVGTLFLGECGYFTEIKRSDLMTENDYTFVSNIRNYENNS